GRGSEGARMRAASARNRHAPAPAPRRRRRSGLRRAPGARPRPGWLDHDGRHQCSCEFLGEREIFPLPEGERVTREARREGRSESQLKLREPLTPTLSPAGRGRRVATFYRIIPDRRNDEIIAESSRYL